MKPLLLTLALLLAACTSKSTNPKVRIANSGTGLQTWSLPITLAHSLGYYKDEGLDVSIENLPSIVKSLQALIGGSVDAATLQYGQTLQMAAEGQHVQSIFLLNHHGNMALVVAPSASKRIQRIEDLRNATIGVSAPGSTSHQWLGFLLAKHGIRPTEVSIVGIGVAAPRIAAVESGRVDAAVVTGGEHIRLLRRHPDLRILIDESTPEGMLETYGVPTYAGGTLSAKQDWLKANPDTARRLARALLRTHQWIALHSPEQIREKLPDGFRSDDAALDSEVIRSSLSAFTPDGKMPLGAPEIMKRYVEATVENVRNYKIDLNATWTNEFLPDSK